MTSCLEIFCKDGKKARLLLVFRPFFIILNPNLNSIIMRKGLKMLAAAMLLSLASVAQNLETVDVSRESDGNYSRVFGEYRIEGQVKNGKKEGTWCEYYAGKNMLRRMAQYDNGKLNGPFIEVDETGSVFKKSDYKDNKLDGALYHWAAGGRLTSLNHFKEGEYHGEQHLYYDNGNHQEVSTYKDGQRDGVTVWYNREGAKRMLITYKDGLFDGKQETYYPNGNIKTSKMYKDNVQEGEAVEYYESGGVKSEAKYKKGALVGKVKNYKETQAVKETKEDMDKALKKDTKDVPIESKRVILDSSKKMQPEKKVEEKEGLKKAKKG
jgi:antitoxin component YwqK of YwqJK toxin-antitoxin module